VAWRWTKTPQGKEITARKNKEIRLENEEGNLVEKARETHQEIAGEKSVGRGPFGTLVKAAQELLRQAAEAREEEGGTGACGASPTRCTGTAHSNGSSRGEEEL